MHMALHALNWHQLVYPIFLVLEASQGHTGPVSLLSGLYSSPLKSDDGKSFLPVFTSEQLGQDFGTSIVAKNCCIAKVKSADDFLEVLVQAHCIGWVHLTLDASKCAAQLSWERINNVIEFIRNDPRRRERTPPHPA
jgi:hypothetical protein